MSKTPSSIALIKKLNELVGQANPESAFNGLEEITKAFRILLICYAKPNPNSELGTADNPQAFLHHFSSILDAPIKVEHETRSDTMPGV